MCDTLGVGDEMIFPSTPSSKMSTSTAGGSANQENGSSQATLPSPSRFAVILGIGASHLSGDGLVEWCVHVRWGLGCAVASGEKHLHAQHYHAEKGRSMQISGRPNSTHKRADNHVLTEQERIRVEPGVSSLLSIDKLVEWGEARWVQSIVASTMNKKDA